MRHGDLCLHAPRRLHLPELFHIWLQICLYLRRTSGRLRQERAGLDLCLNAKKPQGRIVIPEVGCRAERKGELSWGLIFVEASVN